MSIEEKAKAYKEALERAKQVYSTSYTAHWDIMKDLIEHLFPELKESEDERIRKNLIELLLDTPAQDIISHHLELSEVLAYLEKQKINTEGDFGRGYDCGYEACLNSHGAEWFEKQKEPHFTKRNALFDKCVENCDPKVMKEVSDKVDEMLQKEQKPIEDSGTAEPDYGICDDYIPAAIHVAMARHGWYAGHVGEEEEFVLQRKKNAERNWPADKDNLTQEQKEQKPAEWSEEDEHYFQNLIMAVDSTFSEGNTKNWLQNRFKSLRPQPHWKPSAEQMEALNSIILTGSFTYVGQTQDLISLKDELKKL